MADPSGGLHHADGAGTFVLSIDLELIWGVHDRPYRDDFIPLVRAAREAVPRLVELLDRYEVPATWAVVGHLLEECDEACERVDEARAVPGPRRLPCRSELDEELWRLPELPRWLQDADVEHEVAGHGFWHLDLDEEAERDRKLARQEFGRSFRAVARIFGRPVSYVYPRDRVAFPAELARAGFRVARTRPASWFERAPGLVKRPMRFLAEGLRLTPPSARTSASYGEGPVLLAASQQLRPLRGVWDRLPSGTRTAKARKGLGKAARGGVYHLWLHPHDLVDADGEADRSLDLLDEILRGTAGLRDDGRMRVRTMSAAQGPTG